jgi:hypothetical protein
MASYPSITLTLPTAELTDNTQRYYGMFSRHYRSKRDKAMLDAIQILILQLSELPYKLEYKATPIFQMRKTEKVIFDKTEYH